MKQQLQQCVQVLICLVSLVFLVSCQSISVIMPGPYVESPMTVGEAGHWNLQTGLRQAQGVKITANAGGRPPNLNEPAQFPSAQMYGEGIIGLGSRLDVSMSTGYPLGLMVGAKYQFIGLPETETKPGNFVSAIFTNLAYTPQSYSGDQEHVFGPGGFKWEARLNGTALSLGASVGYQVARPAMIYVGFVHTAYQVSYELHQNAARDGSTPAATYTGAQSGDANAVAFGLELGTRVKANLSAQYDWRRWDRDPDNENGVRGNAAVKFLFQ